MWGVTAQFHGIEQAPPELDARGVAASSSLGYCCSRTVHENDTARSTPPPLPPETSWHCSGCTARGVCACSKRGATPHRAESSLCFGWTPPPARARAISPIFCAWPWQRDGPSPGTLLCQKGHAADKKQLVCSTHLVLSMGPVTLSISGSIACLLAFVVGVHREHLFGALETRLYSRRGVTVPPTAVPPFYIYALRRGPLPLFCTVFDATFKAL